MEVGERAGQDNWSPRIPAGREEKPGCGGWQGVAGQSRTRRGKLCRSEARLLGGDRTGKSDEIPTVRL